jgi:hypothetical protein
LVAYDVFHSFLQHEIGTIQQEIRIVLLKNKLQEFIYHLVQQLPKAMLIQIKLFK